MNPATPVTSIFIQGGYYATTSRPFPERRETVYRKTKEQNPLNASKKRFAAVVLAVILVQFILTFILIDLSVAFVVATIPISVTIILIRGWPIAEKPLQRQIKKTTASNLTQLEAYTALAGFLGDQRPLPVLAGWTLAADNAIELVRTVVDRKPHTIVELGSGSSTVILATLARKTGRGAIYSLDHDATYADLTRRQLRDAGLESYATVIDAPLERHTLSDGTETEWYNAETITRLPEKIDLLLVDGPPAKIGALARYPALPILYNRLAPGATVLLDDAGRRKETTVFERWLTEYPAFSGTVLKTSHGLGVLRRSDTNASVTDA